ncbi:endo alpha-1,4 polygalactosaminidase [Antribacter gilvus]|uniref:endo alpha-1,4 polygalactosaminidase n=1 Tax=Antribacter gilvus TaxID=2304675 RepID=UPI000F773E86|nr:endo alpha-1,4 polygalactosaminidase [Antribacter gilvus]
MTGRVPLGQVVRGLAAVLVLLLAACGTPGEGVSLPPTHGVLDYQLGGAYTPPGGLDVVVRDATAEPADGAYSVCYVNGFQTQPGDDRWLDHEDLLLHDGDGKLVVDPAWPDEHVLDPSTAERRERILALVGPVVTGCADAGFDAVELDNLDTWTRFDDPSTGVVDAAGARALAAAYVALAHDAGLAVGQKNAAEVAATARDELGFDFAIAEECVAYDECDAYTAAYGEHVLVVEYPDTLGVPFEEACADPGTPPLTILRDRALVTPDDPGYVYEHC